LLILLSGLVLAQNSTARLTETISLPCTLMN